MSDDQRTRYLAQLLLTWLNERYSANFEVSGASGDALIASDGNRHLGVYVGTMWEPDPAWNANLAVMEERLEDIGRGRYLLWVPPGATLPTDEPDATFFVTRVYAAAESLQPGQRTEVTFPATIRLAKLRDEGGYASVVGGLSRWWTRITENVSGTFSVDSKAIHRLTMDGPAREELWSTIGRLSNGIAVGQSGEFEIEDAWTLQRLPDGPHDGIVLVGAPPKVDPNDGILIRRMTRNQLAAANEALAALDVDLRVVGLIGTYEYMEVETASGTMKAIDPGLYARLQVVTLLADGDVKAVFAPVTFP
jgi:hypothetical protein